MKQNQGLSLIEVVIVVAIIGVLIAVVALPFAQFRQHQALQNSTNATIAVLNDARAKTFAAYNNTSYSVLVATTGVTLFTGTTYDSTASTNESIVFDTPVTASWSLQGSVNKVSFNRLTGATSQYGTITLSLPNGMTRTISITSFGTVARN